MPHRRNLVVVIAAAFAMFVVGCRDSADRKAADAQSTRSAAIDEAMTGAHQKHVAATSCSTCHMCDGFGFDPVGAAVRAGEPPSYDPENGTCSNVACHGVPAGTYGYWAEGGDGEPVYTEVSYGGGSATTASWYSDSSSGTTGCTGCHGNPPTQHQAWHGYHAYWVVSNGNSCTLCHPHVLAALVDSNPTLAGVQPTSNKAYVGTAISTATNCGPLRNQPCAPMHRNGVVDVNPTWNIRCRGCH